MITIGIPSVEIEKGSSRLSAEINIDGRISSLWVEVDAKYKDYLCYERCDAFVLGLLHYAMKYNHDIECKAPITDRLYEQLTEQFLPAFSKVNHFDRNKSEGHGWDVKIHAPLAPEVEHPIDGVAVGSGCSCGVDSMHVYATHPEITHSCVWNVHGVTYKESKEKRDMGWRNLVNQAKRFASDIGTELIVGDSNYDRGCFENLMFDGSISYGNLFFVFALQKLWRKYYVASGYDISEFRLDGGVNADPAHYEYLLFSFCSLKNIAVAIDGVARTRIQKVEDLVAYPLSRKYLNVCWEINEDGRNCSYRCAKCMRTMLELDMLGVLDQYSELFDVSYYRKNFHEYLAEFYRGRLHHDVFALELKPYMDKKTISFSTQMNAWQIVMKKILKKILRGGATMSGAFAAKG